MALDLSFKQVCEIIIKDQEGNHPLIDCVDKLLGLTLLCGPIFGGPAAAAFLPLITAKNELIRLGKDAFKTFSSKKDDDYVARQQRMQVAYGLICFTAFFEALDRQIPSALRNRIGLLKEEKIFLASSTRGKGARTSEILPQDSASIVSANPLATLAMSFPHPTETLAQQSERLSGMWIQMARGFVDFIKKLAFWEEIKEKEQTHIIKALDKLPQLAAECFEAQYFELARRYEDFAVWANLHEHKKTKALIGSLSEYVKQHAALVASAKSDIDTGFAKMHEAVLSIPESLKMKQAAEIVASLEAHYKHRIIEPIAEGKEESRGDRPRLRFPRTCDAFVPQSFRVLRYSVKAKGLEDEGTWKDLERRDDLGAFLLTYLSSPYSTETPLIVLGHPGSGKSLLTTVLSAQLMSKHFTAIRVPLREVNAEAGIVAQIEERIRRITNISVDSWAKLSSAFKNNPPLVILDGYDELLQASGRVFSGYLNDVKTFQQNETEQGRPVRVIVTSRITLIDKATIPEGATIIRLLEFDKRQRDCWIAIWNQENANYFKETKIKEFALPKETGNGAAKILSLGEQPLLLMMLALYDSDDNELRKRQSLDRTILYDSLLRRFVVRERAKDRRFAELTSSEQKKEIDSEMQRLAVAALGMYNRRKLHILSTELNEDIKFFNLERPVTIGAGRLLTQADLLLGSFFFVHKSKAQLTAGAPEHHEETAAFEFLHNTFGEFLTADFILRQTLTEVAALKALKENEDLRPQLEQRLGAADGFSRAWFASLVYTPLFTRPVVLEMMREWLGHALKRRQISKQDFVNNIDTIVLNQLKRLLDKREMPSIIRKETAQEGYRAPFGDHPLLGHIAIYSMNLILLRVIVSDEPFVFDEKQIGIHEDGARPWDRLAHIWRSWFALDNLNGVTAVLLSDREESRITLLAKRRFQMAESQNRLETCLNVALSLGDNIASGLTGLLCFESRKDNPLELEDIAERLKSERIDLNYQIALKRLFRNASLVNGNNAEELCRSAKIAFQRAEEAGRGVELVYIAMGVRRGLRRLSHNQNDPPKVDPNQLIEVFRESISPRDAIEVSSRDASAGLVLYQAAMEIGDYEWMQEFRHMLFEFGIRRHHLTLELDIDLTGLLDWIQLLKEVGGEGIITFVNDRFFDRAFHPSAMLGLANRDPKAALALLQVLREEVSDEEIIRHMGSDFFERALDPDHLMELAELDPEAALAWMQLGREIDGERFLKLLGPRFFDQAFKTRHFVELIERNPAAALAWVRLAIEAGGIDILRHAGSEFIERVFHPRHILKLVEKKPEVALVWMRLARHVGGDHYYRHFAREFVDRFLSRSFFERGIYRNPATLAAIVQLLRVMKEVPNRNELLTRLSSSLFELGGNVPFLEQIPISSLPDIQWLAIETSQDQSGRALLDWLRKNGLAGGLDVRSGLKNT